MTTQNQIKKMPEKFKNKYRIDSVRLNPKYVIENLLRHKTISKYTALLHFPSSRSSIT